MRRLVIVGEEIRKLEAAWSVDRSHFIITIDPDVRIYLTASQAEVMRLAIRYYAPIEPGGATI